jgi:hypothetical protein
MWGYFRIAIFMTAFFMGWFFSGPSHHESSPRIEASRTVRQPVEVRRVDKNLRLIPARPVSSGHSQMM